MTEINNKKLCESCFAETDSDVCPECGFSKSEFTPDPLVLPMGTRLDDKIVIGRVMGKGGFGVTYLGYDTRMNKIIAVKEYYPNGIAYRLPSGTEVSVADANSAEAFKNGAEKFYAEAEMVAQFNGNPNIVSVYDYFKENNTVYLVMEYISGVTLKNYIKNHGRLTDGQALYVMDKIAAALSITHSAGVLHRDISPDNIMICRDGKVKLIDFGAARQIMAESSANLTVVMKPGYTPVEQYTKKGQQGAWTDIYSLGVSVYYALTGVIIDDPYARMDDDSELDENKHGINSDLWAILKKCTMINAPDRYGSAIDLRKALKSVSAPIKAERIELTDDDLKADSNSNSPIAPDVVTSKKEVSLSTAAPVSKAPESIEIFEDSIAAPPAADYTADRKGKGKKKKIIIGSVCTAAVVLLGIFAIGLMGNRRMPDDREMITSDVSETSETVSETTKKETESTTQETTWSKLEYVPDKTDGVIVLDDTDLYWSSTKSIPKSALIAFDGDVRVKLKLEPINMQKNQEDDGYWRGLGIIVDENEYISVNPVAYSKDNSLIDVNSGDGDFVFVIPRVFARSINNKISFEQNNVLVKSVVLEDDSYDKNINFDGEYNGDWELINGSIPIEDMTCYDGDVRITLDVDINIFRDKSDYLIDGNPDMPMSFIKPMNVNDDGSWTGVEVLTNDLVLLSGDTAYMFIGTGKRQLGFTISQDELKNNCQNALYFQVCNCVVTKAYIGSTDVSERKDSTSSELPAVGTE